MKKIKQFTVSVCLSTFVAAFRSISSFPVYVVALISVLSLQGCAGVLSSYGTSYQTYDGRLGYQEKTDSKGRLVVTYFASDTTDWATIGSFVDQRLEERKTTEPCIHYEFVRDEKTTQRVTIQRRHDAQYSTVLGLNARWDIRTHEPIVLNIPADVRVYQRVLKPVPLDTDQQHNCASQ